MNRKQLKELGHLSVLGELKNYQPQDIKNAYAQMRLDEELGEGLWEFIGDYSGRKNKHTYRCTSCGFDHIIRFDKKLISSGRCAKCSSGGRILKLTQEVAESRAKEKGFELLSKYTGYQEYHDFRCPKGHEYNRRFDVVMHGSPCPVCRKNMRTCYIDKNS